MKANLYQQALETIHELTRDMNRDDFVRDRRTVDAVLRNPIVVGEAVTET